MFDGKYLDWNKKRVKAIIDFYDYKFFYNKTILDLGCGHGDIGVVFQRLGADITAVDARQEHLNMINKRFAGIKTVRADLDQGWPFNNRKFDMVLDLGLLCHLNNYESHLRSVCNAATHLILETAVCDSEDDCKSINVKENKAIYDLAFNGMGSRPTAAMIERILSECGMNFRRVDQAKLNSEYYCYNWMAQNNDTHDLSKRRMWFAVKNTCPMQFSPLPKESVQVLQTILPPPPVPPSEEKIPVPITLNSPSFKTNINFTTNSICASSREFAILRPEKFEVPTAFPTGGVVLPLTLSSRMWIKKIAPLFPNLKLSQKALTMLDFNKVEASINVILSDIHNIHPCDRIWIEEWSNINLTEGQIRNLSLCKTIMTPSLLNAQEIAKAIPNANIVVVNRPWPFIKVEIARGDYYIYFEKDPNLTRILLESWIPEFGNLLVVGSSINLPSFAQHISNYKNYKDLIKICVDAKAVIDLSNNLYYKSGILELFKSYCTPIITNNISQLDNNLATIIPQDKTISSYPTSDNIRESIKSFLSKSLNNNLDYNYNHNNTIYENLQKMVGA